MLCKTMTVRLYKRMAYMMRANNVLFDQQSTALLTKLPYIRIIWAKINTQKKKIVSGWSKQYKSNPVYAVGYNVLCTPG